MKSISTLTTAAAVLALGLAGVAYAEDAPGAKSDLMIAAEEPATQGGTEVDENAADEAIPQEGENAMPDEGAGYKQEGGDQPADQSAE